MLTISVWPRRLKEFLLTHPLYKSPPTNCQPRAMSSEVTVGRAGGRAIIIDGEFVLLPP